MGGNCEACPVRAGLACYREPLLCERAAMPGEDVFRGILAEHAEVRARPTRRLSGEEWARIREAVRCEHRDCAGCGCDGCRCGPGGKRPGEVVTLEVCKACLATSAAGDHSLSLKS